MINTPSIVPLIRKESLSMLNTATAYIVAVLFLMLTSLWFLNIYNFAAGDYASFREYFSIFPFIFILIIPLLTMRLWAEEHKSGTSEILLTMPYSETQLVIGKFIAVFGSFTLLILMTLPMLLILTALGDFAAGPIFTQYLGVILLGAASLSIGQMISSLSRNQISAALITIAVLLMVTIMFEALALLSNLPLWLAELLQYFSVNYHFSNFARGVLDSRDLLYFLLMTGFFLYLNRMVLIFRKWS